MKNYFSKNLKFLREQKKLSQNKLGELANVNQTTIARWENEEMAPSIDNVIELSKIFNIDLADLLGRDLQLNEDRKQLTEKEEMEMLKNTLKKKGFLDENEELSEENFNTLIEFAKANKQFIMKDHDNK
mgnify:FL=1|jgi:transcriptional regulator with XRE-family HTH domain